MHHPQNNVDSVHTFQLNEAWVSLPQPEVSYDISPGPDFDDVNSSRANLYEEHLSRLSSHDDSLLEQWFCDGLLIGDRPSDADIDSQFAQWPCSSTPVSTERSSCNGLSYAPSRSSSFDHNFNDISTSTFSHVSPTGHDYTGCLQQLFDSMIRSRPSSVMSETRPSSVEPLAPHDLVSLYQTSDVSRGSEELTDRSVLRCEFLGGPSVAFQSTNLPSFNGSDTTLLSAPVFLFCSTCKCPLSDFTALSRHERTHHALACSFKGLGCTFACATKTELKNHTSAVHHRQRPFLCALPMCNRAFGRQDNLNRHRLKCENYTEEKRMRSREGNNGKIQKSIMQAPASKSYVF